MFDPRCESVPRANGLTHRLNEGVIHFRSCSATMADQVVMRLVEQLVLARPAAEIGHTDEAQFTVEIQGAVDGGTVHSRKLRLHAREHVICRQVTTWEERAEDNKPLRGYALPCAAEPIC